MILEFILVLPILIIATLAIFEFSYLLLVGHTVNTATIEGARKAAELGGEANQGEPVAEHIREILQIHQIDVSLTQPAAPNQGDSYLRIDYGNITIPDRVAASNQSYEWGDLNLAVAAAAPGTNQVIITLRTPVSDNITNRPVPDLLATFGFSINAYNYQYQSLANLE